MSEENKIQQKYMEFQYLQQQLEQVNQNLEILNQQLAEVDISINAVKELEKSKVDNEMLASIANGIFLKAKLQDNQKLIVNVGSNTTVEKSIPDVVKLLESQKVEIEKNKMEMNVLFQQLNDEAMKIFQEVEATQNVR